MKKIFRSIIFFVLLSSFLITSLFGQEKKNLIRDASDFKFKDGIYLNYGQVKTNNPISKVKLLTSADYNDRDFIYKVFETGNIFFYDDFGVLQVIDKYYIWSYAQNGKLYILIQGRFNRITFIGNICYFVANVTTAHNTEHISGGYNPYVFGSSPHNQSTGFIINEPKQYVFDFENGKVLEFTPRNVKLLLTKDPALHSEYVKLSKKMKKELMFLYITKFNEKNPLYLPAK